MPRLKKGPKVLLGLVFLAALFFGAQWGMGAGIIPTPGFMKAKKIETEANIAAVRDAGVTGSVERLPLPSPDPAELPDGPEIRQEVWAWNAQIACLYAVGGKQTTKGSLFEQAGIRASVAKQDDTEQMKNDLIAYSRAYASGERNPSVGVNMINIMGSQTAGFFQSVNPILEKSGDKAEIVYVCGRSDGEDAVLGPPSWKSNPQAAKGGTVSVVPLEGDADLLKKWLKDNDLPFNPDAKTYDPEAVNIIAAETYIGAADKFIAGYCEDRPVVQAGRKTGKTKNVCVDAVSSWTPADVKLARAKGGLVRVVSTHEYSGLMPNVVIVLKRWADDNRDVLLKAVKAYGAAGEQVLGRPEALERACEISYAIYEDLSPSEWCRYYKGSTEPDATGRSVQLGGSRAATLADNATWLGLRTGQASILAHTYTTFGKMLVELYPEQLTEFPDAEDVINTSFVREALKTAPAATIAERQTFTEGGAGARVARRQWHIEFKTGSAGFTPASKRQLDEMLNDLVIAGNLAVEVQGHTDNTGTPEGNMGLSESRAFAVKQYLEAKAPGNFPQGRVTARAFGQTQPVAPNSTAAGKARNRRVDVILRAAQ